MVPNGALAALIDVAQPVRLLGPEGIPDSSEALVLRDFSPAGPGWHPAPDRLLAGLRGGFATRRRRQLAAHARPIASNPGLAERNRSPESQGPH